MTQGRGQLTDRIKNKSKELLGYEMDKIELRLIPYVHYGMCNEQRIDMKCINSEDRKVLTRWRKKKYIEGGASGLIISREFWDIMNEIVFLGYVDID